MSMFSPGYPPGIINGGVILTGPSADGTNGQFLRTNGSGALSFGSVDTSSLVTGPSSATDNTLPRYDGTTGKLIQGSGVTVDDSNNVTGIVNLTASGNVALANTSLVTFGTGVTDVLVKKGASQKLYVRCGDDSGFADLFWRNSEAQNNGYIGWTGRSIFKSPSDGRVNFWNYAETEYSDVYVKGLTASGTGTFGGRIESTASGWSNSQGKFGSLELQSYAANNAWLGENVYYAGSGSNFTYRANGYGTVIRSIYGEVQIETCPSGTAGTAATPTIRAKFGPSGAFGVGGTIDSGGGTYSGAAIIGDSGRNITVGGALTIGASTFAALPSASANTGAILRVTDRGQKLVHSDGTDWRFVHDNTIAS